MRILVNRADDLSGAATTVALVDAARQRGEVQVIGVDQLGMETDGRIWAGASPLTPGELVLIRTNPARDARKDRHALALDLLRMAHNQGVRVVNHPEGLARFQTKLSLGSLPAHLRPRTLVSGDRARLRAFVERAPGPTVVKPLQGTRGRDVFKVHPASENLPQILDVLCREGLAMAQDFVPEAVDGDTRIIVLGGQVLRVGGVPCAVRRVPPATDFRSNVAIGGAPTPAELSPALLQVAQEAAAWLLREGIHFAGLDSIGLQLVEVNVFSTGGLQDAQRFAGQDYVGAVLDYLETVE
jgi:glutathione synthase